MVALLKYLDQKLPESYREKIKNLSKEEQEELTYIVTRVRFNLDAYDLDI